MGRLVQSASARSSGPGFESAGRDGVDGRDDEFASRVSKYIPSEVLAAYLALENILAPAATAVQSAVATTSTAANAAAGMVFGTPAAVIVFLIGLIFTPLYIGSIGMRNKQPWALHALVATLAFGVWAYAMKGSFFTTAAFKGEPLYQGPIAAATLVVFSLVSGLIKPSSRD
jgi:hypothetical protein